MSIAGMMNTTADMKRPVADYDDMGSVVYALTTFAASHPCRISSAVPTEVASGPTEWAEASAMVYTMPGTTFRRDDEVHHDADVYTVLGVRVPSVPGHHTALVCKVKTDGA